MFLEFGQPGFKRRGEDVDIDPARRIEGAGLPDHQRRRQRIDVVREAVDHLLGRLSRHALVEHGDGHLGVELPQHGLEALRVSVLGGVARSYPGG